MSCRCCHSGPKEKFQCPRCAHVCKAPIGWDVTCPLCRVQMINMGHRWRPVKKRKRVVEVRPAYRRKSDGEQLLERLQAGKR
jgi:hypothetical protein